MLIDTHAHLNSPPFKIDLDQVISRCLEENIWVINAGINYNTSKKAIEIAEEYDQGIYAAIGLHPDQLGEKEIKIKLEDKEYIIEREKDFDYEKYRELAKSNKVIAIGEIGLDYWRRPKTKKKQEEFKQAQKDLLIKEIKLAQELNLPIIFHCRLGFEDLIEILQRPDLYKIKAVIHSFTGTWEQAKKFLDMGFYLGFNGIIFKLDLNEVIRNTPLDKILLETDCPYLAPSEFDEQRNNPLAVKIIAEHIAKIKNIPLNQIAEITSQNAKRLFNIG